MSGCYIITSRAKAGEVKQRLSSEFGPCTDGEHDGVLELEYPADQQSAVDAIPDVIPGVRMIIPK
ncbi:MAG: hypothetical protein GC136_09320 [Alphaproteobacteria bacterium]|nr:hypothetical protein [Alphaproteobacteria bacterium]